MELKDLVKYYVPMRMEGSSPPNWEVVFGYDISKFKGYNVDEVRVALNLTQLWLSQGPREQPFCSMLCFTLHDVVSGWGLVHFLKALGNNNKHPKASGK